MFKKIVIISLMVGVVGIPFILRTEQKKLVKTDDNLIVVTAHQGSVRHEFTIAFQEWYKQRTGRTVSVDWRKPGGASEILKFIQSNYENSFLNYWENVLGREWSYVVKQNYGNYKIQLDDTPGDDTEAEAARRGFLEADLKVGFDVWFGGGDYDFKITSRQGILVPAMEVVQRNPIWFTDEVIPEKLSGDLLYDTEFRWFGVVFTSFAIMYNQDALDDLGIKGHPNSWVDLADPIYFNEVGAADPTKSGGTSKLFEVMIQSQMQRFANEYRSRGVSIYNEDGTTRREILEAGWNYALSFIQLMAANARNFTDQSVKPVLDVASGNVAVGSSLDFNGRYQIQNIEQRIKGPSWLRLVLPKGQTALSPDCIGLFKGAPSPKVAQLFIEFVLSLEGQKLWLLKPGTPGGPDKYALRRMPMRKDFYVPEIVQYSTDADSNPYGDLKGFVYQTEWTGPYSVALRFIFKSAFIDAHRELKRAWKAIIKARKQGLNDQAEYALAIMQDLSAINYKMLTEDINIKLKEGDPLEEIQLASELTNNFIKQYKRAYRVAKGLE